MDNTYYRFGTDKITMPRPSGRVQEHGRPKHRIYYRGDSLGHPIIYITYKTNLEEEET